jgi:hypothetical protein
MILSLRSLRAAIAACALTLAGACVPGAASMNPAPDADAGPPPREWTAESRAGEIAAWVDQGCRRVRARKDACVERALTTVLEQAGVSRSMETLDTLAIRDPDVRDLAHALAHGLGISAYQSPETVAATFASCPVSQMSGCFHGVIQGYFLDLAAQGRDIGAAELDALCVPHAALQFIYFQCAHGMGHGLMAVHQNHLPMALESCDHVSNDFVRESCYGGAVMENVVHMINPHHTAAGHAETQGGAQGAQPGADAHAEHGGHAAAGGDEHAGHGAAAGAQAMRHGEWRALDPNDPLYPCNVLDVKYQAACYGFQPSPLMFFNRGDVAATAAVCDRVPQGFVMACFKSLGREVTAWAHQEHPRAIELCGRVGQAGGGRGLLWCLDGAVETLINQTADARDGIRFCRAVEGAGAKESCYVAVGGFMTGLVTEADKRAQQCAAAEPEFVAACRRAAQAEPPARPAGT